MLNLFIMNDLNLKEFFAQPILSKGLINLKLTC